MIKGVNRQMIEVTHTGSPYFERAFLVVRTHSGQPSEKALRQLAEKVVEQGESYAGLRRQRRVLWARRAVFALLWSGVGAALLWLLERIAV